ncbi:hypothetical protein NECID01_1432 [Nematocida sp. AWRm77]|nr:hypothetical protein NECID01_1432 [Nematocida sp. AWRm77]
MASFTYKCIRRLVNVLAFFLLVLSVSIILYPCIYIRVLESLEKQMHLRFLTSSSFLYYNTMLSLFLAMLSSTSVNSKSKFTLKIAIFFGIFYLLAIGSIIGYLQLSYRTDVRNIIITSGTTDDKASMLSSIINITLGDTLMIRRSNPEVVTLALELVHKELDTVLYFSLGGELICFTITFLMILGINCKISNVKDAAGSIKVSEGVPRTVGWSTPAQSLRKKIQKQAGG